jgi:hypothetical protein
VHNTRTEQVVFDIVDKDYPYNAIIGQGILNAFEAVLYPAYLCMKIPSDQGPIDVVRRSQEAARRVEGNWTDSSAIHNIDEAEAHQQHKYIRDKETSANHPKSMLLCEDIAEQKCCLNPSYLRNKKRLYQHSYSTTGMSLLGQPMICVVSTEMSLSILSM